MKRRFILIITGLALAAAIAALIATRPAPSDSYRYQGKTVRQWLETVFTTNQTAALAAFSAMGTNAMPGLLREFRRNDSWWNKLHRQLYPRFPAWLKSRNAPPVSQETIWSAAELVLLNCHYGGNSRTFATLVEALGNESPATRPHLFSPMTSLASPRWDRDSVPALTALSHNNDLDTRAMAAYLLWQIDRQTNLAVAVLHEAMNSRTPSYMRVWAPNFLFNINPDDPSLMPIFIAHLRGTNTSLRYSAALAIGHFGTAASNAIPALTNLLYSPNPFFNHQVFQAIEAIDPQTADRYRDKPQNTK